MDMNHSENGVQFDYNDIYKRSMLADQSTYRNVVSILSATLGISIIPKLESLTERYGFQRYDGKIRSMLQQYRVRTRNRSNNKKAKLETMDCSLNQTIRFPPCLALAMMYVVVRKDGSCLNRDKLCDEYSVQRILFDDTVRRIEDMFPDYSF